MGAPAPPLILLAIIQALNKPRLGGRQAMRLAGLLLINTIVAIVIGLLVANILQPGRWAHVEPKAETKNAAEQNLLTQFLERAQEPAGPLSDDGKVMGVIFLAVAFGIALRRLKNHPVHTVEDFVHVALASLITVLHWIIDVIPLAVFGIVASIVGLKGFSDFVALGGFVVAVLVGLACQAVYYLVRVRFGSWVRPRFVWHARCAGDGVLDRQFDRHNAGHVRLLAREGGAAPKAKPGAWWANFNNDGTALYEAMSALFVSQLLVAGSGAAPLTMGSSSWSCSLR